MLLRLLLLVPAARAALCSKIDEPLTAHVEPKNIHSHNDYSRGNPFFEGLSLGVKSFEADLHIVRNGEATDLAVSHGRPRFGKYESFKELYLDRIEFALGHAASANNTPSAFHGVYVKFPSVSIQLLLDYKSDDLHALVIDQLATFRSLGLLTTYDARTDETTAGPVTVVCSGSCRLEDVLAQQPRDVFFDAPFDQLNTFEYGREVAPLASASLRKMFGKVGSTNLNRARMARLYPLLEIASTRGIKTRIWDNPSWPSCIRIAVWRKLWEAGVYWMNADDLRDAARVSQAPWNCPAMAACVVSLTVEALGFVTIAVLVAQWAFSARRRASA